MITVWLLACAPIVVIERTEVELDPVDLTAVAPWEVVFEVTASEAAMARYHDGEVSALARDVELGTGQTLTGALQVGDEIVDGTLDPEWENTLELWVEPWGNCWAGACTLSGVLELSSTAEATVTPVLVGTLLLESHRSSLPDDATVEISVLE